MTNITRLIIASNFIHLFNNKTDESTEESI